MTADTLDTVEAQMVQLRAELRAAILAGQPNRARALRTDLGAAEATWYRLADALTPATPRATRTDLPVREHVHQTLVLLGAPAGPPLITSVAEAFFSAVVPAARLGTMRRDEERSFQSQPGARPYYLCAALTASQLTPARGLLAVSSWPLEQRLVTEHSARVDYLTHTIRVAEQVQRILDAGSDPSPAAWLLLERLARNIPGVAAGRRPTPEQVIRAAQPEHDALAPADNAARHDSAERARAELADPARLLFGAPRRPAK
ncbi:hypothetical protein GCM10017744_103340 [Streptomyces antimycoticus]|uniref:Uncharacterized protein n=1 Tax=Streptomyces antimycoticus TaxID=68175 RepID=A0A4D4KSE0_9ACTN|nr:hypothetical protein [Streptomyces antimycoticus]GDY49368.1 hypothetical protein SANT12839_102500 [Streptomyces antimycoticus]